MTNEAVLKVKRGTPIDFAVGNNIGIEKGSLLRLYDARTVSGSSAAGVLEVFAGIARREKISGDGRTQLSVFTDGIFDIKLASGANVQAGEKVIQSGANLICSADELPEATSAHGNTLKGVTRALVSGALVGKALESGINEDTIEVDIGIR